ncbi:hypothetical protein OS493_040108, partial [Desmophyllum pertusum]
MKTQEEKPEEATQDEDKLINEDTLNEDLKEMREALDEKSKSFQNGLKSLKKTKKDLAALKEQAGLELTREYDKACWRSTLKVTASTVSLGLNHTHTNHSTIGSVGERMKPKQRGEKEIPTKDIEIFSTCGT